MPHIPECTPRPEASYLTADAHVRQQSFEEDGDPFRGPPARGCVLPGEATVGAGRGQVPCVLSKSLQNSRDKGGTATGDSECSRPADMQADFFSFLTGNWTAEEAFLLGRMGSSPQPLETCNQTVNQSGPVGPICRGP